MARYRSGYLVGLTGFAGSGKDTAAAGLVAAGWKRQAFADPLKAMALAIDPWIMQDDLYEGASLSWWVDALGWEGAKGLEQVRRFLQRLGTDVVRVHLGEDAWVRAFDRARDRRADTVATDVRFPNEAAYIHRHGGIIIRIDRPGVGPINGHDSETQVDAVEADATVVNDGSPEQLQIRVADLVGRHYGTRLEIPL